MAEITFISETALSTYHCMAEDMLEVANDDDETVRARKLSALIERTGADATTFPHTATLPDSLTDIAEIVLENCLDSESTDEDALKPGMVTIAGVV